MAMLHAGWQANTDRRWTHTTIPQLPLTSNTHFLHSVAQSPPPPISSYLFGQHQPPAVSSPIALTAQSAYQQAAYFPVTSNVPLHTQPTQHIVQHQQQQAPATQASSAGFFHRLGSHFSSLLPFSFSLPFPLHSLQQQQQAPQQQSSSVASQHNMARRDNRYVSHASQYHDTLAPPAATHTHHHGHQHSTHSRRSPSRSSSATSSIHSNSTYSSRGSHHPRSNNLAPTSGRREHRHHDRHRHRRTPSASMRTASVGSEGRKEDQEGLVKVKPGEYLHHGRYKVLGIAGQGTFGTVLDVYDVKHQQRLALKVVRSVQRYLEAAAIEIEILEKLRQADPRKESSHNMHTNPTTSYALCVRLYRDFELHHAGQKHVCIGTEKLGRSLYEFLKKNQYRGFQLHSVRLFAYQLISAVAFCHSIGLIHTDLKPENILLAHSEYVTTTYKGHSDYRVPRSHEIRLIDFGGATFDTDHHSRIINTRQYRAPEVLLGLGWSFPSDMWSVGCILCELVSGELLFATHHDLEHLAMMEKVLEEELPRELGERAIRPWRAKREEEKEREREREKTRSRSRKGGAVDARKRGDDRWDVRSGRDGKRGRSPHKEDKSKRRKRSRSSSFDHSTTHHRRSRSYSPHSTHRRSRSRSSSASLSPSLSRDRSSSRPRVNHLLSLATAQLRWPPHSSSTSSLKHVRRRPTLRALLLDIDPQLFALVRQCLQWDDRKRVTAAEALRHDFFRGTKEELVREKEQEREDARKREDRRRREEEEERKEADRGLSRQYSVTIERVDEDGRRDGGGSTHGSARKSGEHRR